MEAANISEVDENEAIELLASCQECSRYFSDFDFRQLITLSKELTILHFRERETVLYQGEPATFFGVVLKERSCRSLAVSARAAAAESARSSAR